MFKCNGNKIQVLGEKEETSLNNSWAQRVNHDHGLFRK